jgi:hypothetical protein
MSSLFSSSSNYITFAISSKRIAVREGYDRMTICARLQRLDHARNCISLLDYEFTLSIYCIKNTRVTGL